MAAFHCQGRPIVRCIDRRKTVAKKREVKIEGGRWERPQTGCTEVTLRILYGNCLCVEIRVSDILLLRPNVLASSDTQTVAVDHA